MSNFTLGQLQKIAIDNKIREMLLLPRIRKCVERISDMCNERRPPSMSIPVQWYDDDVFITLTLQDAEARIVELVSENDKAIRNDTQLQRAAFNDGLAAGKIKEWVFLSKEPENLPGEGDRVVVLYRHAGLQELVDMADYLTGLGGAKWWHTDNKRAYDRSRDEIIAWMPAPGVPYIDEGEVVA